MNQPLDLQSVVASIDPDDRPVGCLTGVGVYSKRVRELARETVNLRACESLRAEGHSSVLVADAITAVPQRYRKSCERNVARDAFDTVRVPTPTLFLHLLVGVRIEGSTWSPANAAALDLGYTSRRPFRRDAVGDSQFSAATRDSAKPANTPHCLSNLKRSSVIDTAVAQEKAVDDLCELRSFTNA